MNTVNNTDVNSAATDHRKAYRAKWMREKRQRDKAQSVAGNNQPPEINGKSDQQLTPEFPDTIKPAEPVIENKPEPQLENKPDPVIENKSEASIDPATARIREQLEADRQAQELNQLSGRIRQTFSFWQQSGLSETQLRLLAADPIGMLQLTDAASQQAVAAGHQFGVPAHLEETRKWFVAQLDNVQRQIESNQHAAVPQPMENSMPIDNQNMPSPPMPMPSVQSRPQAPSRSGLYSAPVSRETVGSRDPGPRTGGTLSTAEAEAARISGITPAEYLKQKWKLQELRAAGLYDSEPQRR